MADQDKSGVSYESLIASALQTNGYVANSDCGPNYIQPSPRQKVVIEGTYIQPDFVVRVDKKIVSIIYVTHWSNKRSSKYKFWRTWEEAAQQKVVLGDKLVTINCVFEALPRDHVILLCHRADELPKDKSRNRELPQQLQGWDPAIGWALVEAFDVSLICPVGVGSDGKPNSGHERAIREKLNAALLMPAKAYLYPQWDLLRRIAHRDSGSSLPLRDIKSRYRIALLHLYLVSRVSDQILSKGIKTHKLIEGLGTLSFGEFSASRFAKAIGLPNEKLGEAKHCLETLASIPVRGGKVGASLIRRRKMGLASKSEYIYALNDDLKFAISDVVGHLRAPGFGDGVLSAFKRYDSTYGVLESIDDLAHHEKVLTKADYLVDTFSSAVTNSRQLADLLERNSHWDQPERNRISSHRQNWVFEMLLHALGLSSTAAIQKRFQRQFESHGHLLRPHAPWGDTAATVIYLLQGMDLCSQWKGASRTRTLSAAEFEQLAWRTVAELIVESAKADRLTLAKRETIAERYRLNRAMRLIGSDLNGFEAMAEYFLRDRVVFNFGEQDDVIAESSALRNLASVHTDLMKSLWGARPLETRAEGASKSGQWVVKIQSAQDGNEGHKTKELAGRSRGIRITVSSSRLGTSPSDWDFALRACPKLALLLDGDWSEMQQRNLLEAGWDWVGDIGGIPELCRRIDESEGVGAPTKPEG